MTALCRPNEGRVFGPDAEISLHNAQTRNPIRLLFRRYLQTNYDHPNGVATFEVAQLTSVPIRKILFF